MIQDLGCLLPKSITPYDKSGFPKIKTKINKFNNLNILYLALLIYTHSILHTIINFLNAILKKNVVL
jgi:hypothetical protein